MHLPGDTRTGDQYQESQEYGSEWFEHGYV